MQHARTTFGRFFQTYNRSKIISSLNYQPTLTFLKQWQAGNLDQPQKSCGVIKQKFFFRGQRPKWRSVLPEVLSMIG